jgi:hypothetical protein
MGQTYSYKEYMDTNDIPNSFDGLDEERIEFEKKIKFLILVRKMGTFDFFGSKKYEQIDSFQITRTDIKNYLESFDIKKHLDWINYVLPNKVINVIKKPMFINYDIEQKILSDEEYLNKINLIKCNLVKEIYSTLNDNDKNIIYENLFCNYPQYIYFNEFFQLFIKKYGPKDNSDAEIKIFFENFVELDRYNVHGIDEIIQCIDDDIKKTKSISKSWFSNTNIITWNERFEYFKNNHNFQLKLQNYEKQIKKKIYGDFKPNEKIKFTDDYFNDASSDLLIKIANDYTLDKFFRTKIINNVSYKQYTFDIKYDLMKTKYFNELDEEKKSKLTDYKLDYNSHYELFKLDETKYMKILLYNDQIDDYTFNHWEFDNWEFLNKFNEVVQMCLKQKILVDAGMTAKNQDEHCSITLLDNYIDTMYFIYNPPVFLRRKGIKYYQQYIDLMNKFAKDFDFDFEKINYLNMKPRIVFDFD